MSGLVDWIVKLADLFSALFGLAAGVVLAIPAWTSVGAKSRWEAMDELDKEYGDDEVNAKALKMIRQTIESDQLGGSRETRTINRLGFGLLIASFLFLAIASFDRMHERAEAAAARAASAQKAPG